MNRAQRRASKANGRKMMKQGWTAFEDWTLKATLTPTISWSKRPAGLEKFYQNSLYSVQLHRKSSEWGEIVLLMVRRNDEAPVRSWPDMQRIKNEIVGPERVAVEVYPDQADVVDQANMYHLWVLPKGFKLPFGLHFREQENQK